ncbi:Long-chain-fatty-acid--CoA ligase [Chondromyces apiculatus DSM 436]|uniref:Long-chain-fatty-acid--CoA ligase n=2 Tax=Chondromyces apiculatus TaxID=51 RepID=A0A017T7M3_9BACT|nr:Long-chain-fatty-acid--CoA ligase [Chondromyces apiculatus DSM 436]
MLSVFNTYSHGYVAIPVIEACRAWGLFRRLDAERPVHFAALSEGANRGYLRVALHMLESLGWVTRTTDGAYLLTEDARPHEIPEGAGELYRHPIEDLLQRDEPREILLRWIRGRVDGRGSASPQVTKLLDGVWMLPLFLALRERQRAGDAALFAGLDAPMREALRALFLHQRWATGGGEVLDLTDLGRQLVERALIMALPASYRPMLARMGEVLFGDPEPVFRVDPVSGEAHVDRRLNVLSSGFQHERYFADVEALVLELFNRLPLEEQPRYVADMGCGDGTFLKQIHALICTRTERGKRLNEFPLRLIGIDYNRAALRETARTLEGLSPILLEGDINDPQRLLSDLGAVGVSDPERILHVRSFLDHNFRYVPRGEGELPRHFGFAPGGVHVDARGESIASGDILEAWSKHLERWAAVVSAHGMILLEVHGMSPQLTRGHFETTESFYFDALHAFSSQHLIDAECFLMLAAGVGLFPRVKPTRYPKTLPFCRITLSHLEKRDYIVRPAEPGDLDALDELERLCWSPEVRTPREELSDRITRYPEGQLVVERREPVRSVVGVIYSQRIERAEALWTCSAREVHRLHRPDGPVVQLLTLNIAPTMQEQQLGDNLLEFMLQRCSMMNGVRSVVGVTRCKSYDKRSGVPLSEYVHWRTSRGTLADPILRFHEMHGARVEGVVPGFRPGDTQNDGHGVLISYEPLTRKRNEVTAGGQEQVERAGVAHSEASIARFVEMVIRRCLGETKEKAFAPDHPLIDMGLDSADLLELNEQIRHKYEVALDPTFFFQYNTAAKICASLERQLRRAPAPERAGASEVREEQARPDVSRGASAPRAPSPGGVAIIGVACRLPGGITTLEQLWPLLKGAGSAIGSLPEGRFPWPAGIDPAGQHRGIDRGGFLREIDGFDASFFRISPKEAESMDPQQRILLELAWEVLEDAGYPAESVAHTDASVFIGASGSDYGRLLETSGVAPGPHFGSGSSMAVLANRISYVLDLNGPSVQIDTACSSSLVALHQAVHALRAGESSLALVGGVNVICHPANSVVYHKAGMLAADGRCKTFDGAADGYVRAEGAIMVLLKPLERAVQDGDRIYAVIRGSATNHGGQASGLTVPNPEQQARLLLAAWRAAGISPDALGYIEAHGTGTSLGDPIEVRGMKEAFAAATGGGSPEARSCGLGSVKSNLGHLEAAAGLAGLLKLLLCLQKRELPATIHFSSLNPHIQLDESPFYIVDRHQEWRPRPGSPALLGGVSSFGSGGANAHVVLEEYRQPERRGPGAQGPHVFVLSAKNEEQLRTYAGNVLSWLRAGEREATATFADVVFTFQKGRQAMDERLAMVVASEGDLSRKLARYIARERDIEDCYQGNLRSVPAGMKALVQGAPAEQLGRLAAQRGDLGSLASLWAAGVTIDWEAMHDEGVFQGSGLVAGGDHGLRHVSAPTYPFAHERHWLPGRAPSAGAPGLSSVAAPGLHPLLDSNESTLKEQKYRKVFDRKVFYLEDHVVHGQVILPGVAHLEMARAAGARALGGEVVAVRDVMWGRPVLLQDATCPVAIHLVPRGDVVSFEIRRDAEAATGGAWVFSQGTMAKAESTSARPEKVDLGAIRARCSAVVEAHAIDAHLKDLGFDYGPSFQLTESMYVGEEEALMAIRVPEALWDGWSTFVWHPSLLDTAVRACFMIGLGKNDLNATLRIPFSLGSLRAFGSVPKACLSYARLVKKHENGDYVADISILDMDGVELLRFEDFCFKRFKAQPVAEPKKEEARRLPLYQPVWERTELPAVEVRGVRDLGARGGDRRILVVDTTRDCRDTLAEHLSRNHGIPGEDVIWIEPHGAYRPISSVHVQIAPGELGDARKLLAMLESAGRRPTDVLYALPCATPQDDEAGLPGDEGSLAQGLNRGLHGLMSLVKALMQQAPRHAVRVVACFPEDPRALPLHETIAGLARSIPGIAPAVSLVTVRVDATQPSRAGREALSPSLLARELLGGAPNGTEILYRSEERFTRHLQRLEDADRRASGPTFRQGGTYLITGGLGGIGLQMASFLASLCGAHLLLLGRSSLDARGLERLATLRETAGSVTYLQVDVADRQGLAAALEEARRGVGSLHGVLHCAGLAGEPFTPETTAASFEQGMRAKVHGTVNLDLATRDDPLDFFLLFSSLSSFLGDFGRGSYAAGNRFLDGFAAWRGHLEAGQRRHGKTISVNWPYWKEGGFQDDFFRDERGRALYFEHGGFTAITAAEGQAILEEALRLGSPQVVVAPGDRRKVERVLGVTGGVPLSMPSATDAREPVPPLRAARREPVPPLAQEPPRAAAKETAAGSGRESAEPVAIVTGAVRYLTGLISEATGVAAAKIDADEGLGAYGIDSMIIMDMNSRLREDFGSLPGTLFFEYSTVRSLAGYFAEHHGDKLRGLLAARFGVKAPRGGASQVHRAATSIPEPVHLRPIREVRERDLSEQRPVARERRDVAIIGVAGRYPQARNLREFWANLVAGRDCIEEIPLERWDHRKYYTPHHPRPDQTNSKWGGFIADVDKFDPLFFNISPREANYMDPQQRLFAEVVWEACEDAGYRWDRTSNRAELPRENNVGVFVGSMYHDYDFLEGHVATSYWASFIANRISYFFNFRGPSVSLDTACSSSLTSIVLAYESVRKGECYAAIAGGTNLSIHPKKYARLSQLNLLSSEGKCRSFGAGGSGYVPGEGVGAILMKSLDDALRDGDHIYGVIKGGALNHGGKVNGFTVPNPNAQASLILDALQNSQVSPRSISYVESHGTGTALGDPIEVAGLTKAFRRHTQDSQFCAIASVKSNVGHLEGAAGVVAVTKVLLQMRYGTLVPSLHAEELNPLIDFQRSPFKVQRHLEAWKRPVLLDEGGEKEGPRVAGISSFGAGGSNAHVLIEEFVPEGGAAREGDEEEPDLFVVPLSAKNVERLRAQAAQLLAFLEDARLRDEAVQGAAWTQPDEGPAVASASARARFAGVIRPLFARSLGVEEHHLVDEERFEDYGVGRLEQLQALEAVQEEFGVALDATEFLTKGSLAILLAYLDEKLGAPARPPSEAVSEAVAAHALAFRGPTLRIADVAYTLQVGREAMEERLGLLVTSLEDLEQKLRSFLAPEGPAERRGPQGKRAIEGVYQAQGARSKEVLGAFLGDEDLAMLLDTWMHGRRYEKLVEAWVQGFEVDWNRLHDSDFIPPPRRISLPTYPFARERCWVPEEEGTAEAPREAGQLHPLLGQNVSSFARQRFTTTLTGRELFLTDHVVAQRKVLPGVAYLEMACVGGGIAAERQVSAVRDVVWARPVVVDGGPITLDVDFHAEGDGARFEVRSHDDDGRPGVFAQGRVIYGAANGANGAHLAPPVHRELEAIRARCREREDGADCYRAFAKLGFAYGPSFRCIQEVWRNEHESLSLLELPQEAVRGLDAFRLHPALMDSALHALMLLSSERGAEPQVLVPYSLGALELFGPLTSRCYSLITSRSRLPSSESEERRFDVEILDEQGRLLARLTDLVVRPLLKGAPPPERLYYRQVWSSSPQGAAPAGATPRGPLLVFEGPGDGASAWSEARWTQVVRVRPGSGFKDLGGGRFEVAPGSLDDHRLLLRTLDDRGMAPACVVHAWSRPAFDATLGVLAEQLELGLHSMFALCRALVERRGQQKVHLLYVYRESHPGAEPPYAAVGGFLRSLRQENPHLFCRTVALFPTESVAEVAYRELQPDRIAERAVEVRYGEGQRWAMDLERVRAMPAREPPLKRGGVYLITGGAGGLGLLFGAFLANHHQARVVLCGRSALGEDRAAELRRIQEKGGELVYLQADVAVREEVDALLATIKACFGGLDGILHSAGVARNAYVRNKSRRDIEAVVSAKVFGTVNLDAATKDENLAFFALFSSISAVVDIVGQADYSFANRFLDAFASWRELSRAAGQRRGRTLSINWPLWSEGGMKVDGESELFLQTSMGMTPFEARSGLESFLQAFALDDAQLMVVEGDPRKIERFVVTGGSSRRAAHASAPGDALERLRAEILHRVARFLQMAPEKVGLDVQLTDYGIDSITSMAFVNQLNKELDLALSPAILFEFSTVESLARHLYEHHGESLGRLVPFVEPLPATPPPREPRLLPLSHGQQALWFLHQLAPESAAYHIALTFRIASPLNLVAFHDAWRLLVERHPALRTTIQARQGVPMQEIHDAPEMFFEHVDALEFSPDELRREVEERYRRPFDLARGPLVRVHLFRCAGQDHVFLLNMHHIVADAWSVWTLMRELGVVYPSLDKGESPSLPPLTHSHADFMSSERSMLSSGEGDRLREYWQRTLGGTPPVLNLPVDHPRSVSQTFNGSSRYFTLDAVLSRRLAALAQQERATLFMVLLAAYQILLHRYTGDDMVWIGSPTSGRRDDRFNDVVGYFVNPVVLRGDLSERLTFRAHLKQVRETVLRALEHQHYPFPLLVEQLNPDRRTGRSPLFQAEFVFQKAHGHGDIIGLLSQEPGVRTTLGGLDLTSFPMAQQEGQFDLTLEMMELGTTLSGSLKYNADLFDEATVARMVGHFHVLLESVTAHPDLDVPEHPLVSAGEQRRILEDWNRTEASYPADRPAHRLFEEQARLHPEKEAIFCGGQRLSYQALNARSNRLARRLRALGVGPEILVGICVPRSLDMAVALLGVLKAGGAYVPMDPTYPADRLTYMLEHAKVGVLVTFQGSPVTTSGGAVSTLYLGDPEAWQEDGDGADLDVDVLPDNTAYVIYTSGSTGVPKGVLVTHRALTNFLCSMQRRLSFERSERLLAVTTISFDIAAMELYLPLITGASVVVADRDSAADGASLQRMLATHEISSMQATPATWRLLLASGWKASANLTVFCGGEALPTTLSRQLLENAKAVWNLYGPTETTIWSALAPVTHAASPQLAVEPIGVPIDNTTIYILDRGLRLVPPGVIGDVHIGGDGLARGYLDRPGLTAERFVPDPFGSGARLYRTGDQGRFLADGRIEFVARGDKQLKIRGFRIEPGEIEAALKKHSGVSDCVVLGRDDMGSEKALVAYVVTRSGDEPQPRELQSFLRKWLPEYMIPAAFVALDALPLTPNNKVDRRALPRPDRAASTVEGAYVAPRFATEETLAGLYRDILGCEQVGIHDGFFDIGGSSLLAARLIFRIQETFTIPLPVSFLFEHSTIADLAGAIEAMKAGESTMPRHGEDDGARSAGVEAREPDADDTRLLRIFERLRGDDLDLDEAKRLMDMSL